MFEEISPCLRVPVSPILKVNMAEGIVTVSPNILVSEGLGSCVAVTLYDIRLNTGGMAHIMLPHSPLRNAECRMRNNSEIRNPKSAIDCQFADTAIDALIREMLNRGASLKNIVAKMAGGAKMFSTCEDTGAGLGKENVASVKQALKNQQIPLIGWDVGGDYGRSIDFYLDSGRVVIRAIVREDKEI